MEANLAVGGIATEAAAPLLGAQGEVAIEELNLAHEGLDLQ
jgi:hypothetical protein